MIEGSAKCKKTTKLAYGMVGGGQGAFIGEVHRKAIAMDGKTELVAGCFSRDYQKRSSRSPSPPPGRSPYF